MVSGKEIPGRARMRNSSRLGNEILPVHIVISHHEWALRLGDLLQFKKKNLQCQQPQADGYFEVYFFCASCSEPFSFHFSFEPKGCLIRRLLQTFARRIFSSVPLPCASDTL